MRHALKKNRLKNKTNWLTQLNTLHQNICLKKKRLFYKIQWPIFLAAVIFTILTVMYKLCQDSCFKCKAGYPTSWLSWKFPILVTLCKQRVGCNKDHACFEHLQVFSVNSYTLSVISNVDSSSKSFIACPPLHTRCFYGPKRKGSSTKLKTCLLVSEVWRGTLSD